MKNSPPTDRTLRFFSPRKGDPGSDGVSVLGEKGWRLLQMASLEAPVPPGLVLPAGLSSLFNGGKGARGSAGGNGGKQGGHGTNPREILKAELEKGLVHLEEITGKKFGDAKHPLLLSLRCSPPCHLPRKMETLVNLGLTEAGVPGLAKYNGNEQAAWDAYRRMVEGYGIHVLGVAADGMEELRGQALEDEGAEAEHQLSPKALKNLATAFRHSCEEETGVPWNEDPMTQLLDALEKGFRAWNDPSSRAFRLERGLESLPGMAMVLQAMVSGTRDGDRDGGAGQFSMRVPATGEKKPQGQYLSMALGTDLTAGIRMTDPVASLESRNPEVFSQLTEWCGALERHFRDAQDLSFVVERGELFLLDSVPAPRSPKASLRIAVELEAEGVCDEKNALVLVNPGVIEEYMHPVLDKSAHPSALTKGLPASPGSAVGEVVFFAEHAEELAARGLKTILVRHETTPEDIDGLKVAEGIVTAHGGMTSHAAVVARGMGKCCIVGAGEVRVDYLVNEMFIGNTVIKKGDWISIDGTTGEIFPGELPQVQPALEGRVAKVLEWADAHRKLRVYANADNAEDAQHALEKGAEGIGLCRTEHMFFQLDRIPIFRKMILSIDETGRSAALAELMPFQRRDFMEMFRVMEGKPVTIRLLDPPLNEFLPKGIRSQTRMARAMDIPVETVQQRIETLSENNPMMGHRGCRLAVTYPEIYQMQVRAIVEAACIVKKEGVAVQPEIMVPLVSEARELSMLRAQIEELIDQVNEEMSESISFRIGTMVETPRAAIFSRSIAPYADFYSFGTNDLTQMTYGFSRDDISIFLPLYLEKSVLESDPFIELDQNGTGRLVEIAVEEGRQVNPEIKLGICGEHGGEPGSVKFFHRTGLDYVSCSPFRIPVARLAAGQAAVEEELAANSKRNG